MPGYARRPHVDFTALTWDDPPATVSMGGIDMPGRAVAECW